MHQLLPDELSGELAKGILAVLPVMSGPRELACIILERVSVRDLVLHGVHMDLSRTLEAVINTQKLEQHAANLELLVEARTRELLAEVTGRRLAEEELHRANAELQRSLLLDGLTRIANRVAFQEHLDRQLRDLADTGRELALLMVDVDLFKKYNDHYGHVTGDRALQTVARCLRESVRQHGDLACRYGGEEFAIILPDAGVKEAMMVARRLRARLAEEAIPHATSTVSTVVTASIGLAVVQPTSGLQLETFVEAADGALYLAKSLGRDRISVAARIPGPRSANPDPGRDAADHTGNELSTTQG